VGIRLIVVILVFLFEWYCACLFMFEFTWPGRYKVSDNKHTDEVSLLYLAGNLLNILSPMTFNFISLAHGQNTAFQRVIGQMKIVPFLGGSFHTYLPIFILGFSILTALGFIQKCFRSIPYVGDALIIVDFRPTALSEDAMVIAEGEGIVLARQRTFETKHHAESGPSSKTHSQRNYDFETETSLDEETGLNSSTLASDSELGTELTDVSLEEEGPPSKYGNKRKRDDGKSKPHKESPTEHSTIIFAATKHHVDYLYSLLNEAGFATSYAYGSLDQLARKIQVLNFRRGISNILVVTDVAARGIDIPVLANVINYDFPSQPKIFVHRVGRTARTRL